MPLPYFLKGADMKITIGWFAHAKIMHWIKKAGNLEVSGFGMVQKLEDGRLHVYDAFLIEQENSGGSTDIKPEALAKEMYLKKDEVGEMNFWWHSHHNMAAYMSSVDVATIKEFGGNGWLLATVFNNKNEHKTVLYVNSPFSMYLDNFTLEIATPEMEDAYKKECDDVYKEKCSEKKYFPTHHYGGYVGKGSMPNDSENGRGDLVMADELADWRCHDGTWFYIGDGDYNEHFLPPLPKFLRQGVKEGHYTYDKELDGFRYVSFLDRQHFLGSCE